MRHDDFSRMYTPSVSKEAEVNMLMDKFDKRTKGEFIPGHYGVGSVVKIDNLRFDIQGIQKLIYILYYNDLDLFFGITILRASIQRK